MNVISVGKFFYLFFCFIFTRFPLIRNRAVNTKHVFNVHLNRSRGKLVLFYLSVCRTITGARITSLPSSVCEQLPKLQLLWVQTQQLHPHLCMSLNTELRLKVVPEGPVYHQGLFTSVHRIISAVASFISDIFLSLGLYAGSCCDVFTVYRKLRCWQLQLTLSLCSDLSYNQIQTLPSFSGCESIRKMWV